MGQFDKSYELFNRASTVIPGGIPGHQTPMIQVFGSCPCYIKRAEGARFWDVDGNEYIDYMCGYGPMVIGYNNPKVEAAARAQAEEIDTGNLPTERYIELAEKMVDIIPIADWAIFGKNGSDVTTYACRAARVHTGRSKIVMAEETYHGIGTWALSGMIAEGNRPEDTANMLTFKYNDIEGFKRLIAEHKDEVAGVIITPFHHEATHDSEMAVPGFLEAVRSACDDAGAVFIVDDVRAGFRMHMGGSLERFGVRPDLICFSKALGNGHPISACVGKEDLKDAASQTFFTGSFFTSSAPMAAALATLDEMENIGAIDIMYARGEALKDGMLDQADAHNLEITYSGPESIPFMTFKGEEGFNRDKSRLFSEECFKRGVWLHPLHNWFISAAHTEEDIEKTLEVTDIAFKRVKDEIG